MRTHIIVGAAAMLIFASAAVAETRSLSGFTGVSASDRIHVEVTIGESYRVDVTGSDASKVATRISDRTLHVRRTNRPFWGGTPAIDATVRVTMPAISSLSSSRGAELTATGAASLGGELRAAGVCTNLEAAVSMGGVINAEDLQCREADVAASMGGEARVYASSGFDVAASMGGAVNVAGDGERRDVSLSMGGTLDQN